MFLIFKFKCEGQSPFARMTHQNILIDTKTYPPQIITIPLIKDQIVKVAGYYSDSIYKLYSTYGFINNIKSNSTIPLPYNQALQNYLSDNYVLNSIFNFGDTIINMSTKYFDDNPHKNYYDRNITYPFMGGELNFLKRDLSVIKTIKLNPFTVKATIFKVSNHVYNLILIDTSFIYSYRLTNKKLILMDSILRPELNGFATIENYGLIPQLKFSISGNRIGYLNFYRKVTVTNNQQITEDSGFISVINFDKENCKFINQNKFIEYAFDSYKKNSATFKPYSFEFSPNDSLIYVTHSIAKNDANLNTVIYDIYVRQFNLYNNQLFNDFCSIKGIGTQNYLYFPEIYNTFIAPNGKLFLYRNEIVYGLNNITDSIKIIIDVFNKPDKFGIESNFIKKIVVSQGYLNNQYSPFARLYELPSLNFKPITPLKFICNVSCSDSTILFKSKSHLSFKKIIWHFDKNDSVEGQDVKHHYIKAGKYFVKMKGYFNDWSFIEGGDSIEVKPEYYKPSSYFQTSSLEGCQYIDFNFQNKSKSNFNLYNYPKQKWLFGNGIDSSLNGIENLSYVFNKDGNYIVKLITSNGYCNDTFTKLENISIKKAPKSGIIFEKPQPYCEYQKLKFRTQYINQIDSLLYTYSSNSKISSSHNSENEIVPLSGNNIIYQNLYGVTGCVIKDSFHFFVNKGIPPLYTPEILSVGIKNENVLIKWKNDTLDLNTILFKEDKILNYFDNESNFTDNQTQINEKSYNYYIKKQDVCGNVSDSSKHLNSILLKANAESNEYSILNWNSYNFKPSNYSIIKFFPFYEDIQTSDLKYKDDDFSSKGNIKTCYQIKFNSTNNDSLSVFSNTVCLSYFPSIYIPNSFTPNNDGINDLFIPQTFGISNYLFEVYNTWGEKVFETRNINESWDGVYKNNLLPCGPYMVKIFAKGQSKILNFNQIIQLLY